MKRVSDILLCATIALMVAATLTSCRTTPTDDPIGKPPTFEERIPQKTTFTEAQFAYMGDDVGEQLSDGWLIKFLTPMEIDASGNPVGPGCVMQLLLNVSYSHAQEPSSTLLEGIYTAQRSSGDFAPYTFVDGYIEYIDLPDGRHELPASTFYADIAAGSTEMEVDLLDDGVVEIVHIGDGEYRIEGIMVGKKCQKRYFSWTGKVEPTSYVEPEIPNSTITSDLEVTNLTKALLQDRGDYFALRDESCRCYLLMLGQESLELTSIRPAGSGSLLRIELLVPWENDVNDGIPAGEYPLLVRNADTSIDRTDLVPFNAIPGLPDCFAIPYWSGCWYVEMSEGVWSQSYARLDEGVVKIERGTKGEHIITCSFTDSSPAKHTVAVSATIEELLIVK